MSKWIDNEKSALELINIAGTLWLDKNVELVIFRRNIADARYTEVLNDTEHAVKYLNLSLTIEDFLEIARAIARLDLAPTRIDLATLGKEWSDEKGKSYDEFIAKKLADYIGRD